MYGIYESGSIIAEFAAPMMVRSNQPVFASDTLSLKRDVDKRPAQRWEIESKLVPLTSGASALFTHLVSKGYSEIVNVAVPQNLDAVSRLTTISTPSVLLANAGDFVITVSDNFADVGETVNGLLPRGTFIKFNNHNKLYVTLNDLEGAGSLSIFPALVSGVTLGEIEYTNVLGNFRYDLDTVSGMSYTDGILMDVGTIKLVEAL